MAQRRWKMMFDKRADVLRCEFLDGPPLVNGQELILVEERDVTGSAGGSAPTQPSPGPSDGSGDTIGFHEEGEPLPATADATPEREPVAV